MKNYAEAALQITKSDKGEGRTAVVCRAGLLDCWSVLMQRVEGKERSFGTLKWMILGVETGKTFGNLLCTCPFTLQVLHGDLAISKLIVIQM